MASAPAKGRLVVASPALDDPNFHRTVIYLLAADEDGALGVVLNRPSDTSIDDVVPHWGLHASSPQVLFVGGPVQPNAAICVGRTLASQPDVRGHGSGGGGSGRDGGGGGQARGESGRGESGRGGSGRGGSGRGDGGRDDEGEGEGSGFSPLLGMLGTVDLNRAPEDIAVAFAGLRVFTGYSGWGPGQLEEEIEAGAWFVVEGREADVLSEEPTNLWERVLRRQGGWLAVFARAPVDASLN